MPLAGRVSEDEEALLVLKTSAELVARLADRVKELHPYDVPELRALPVVFGGCAYLEWLASVL